MEEVTLPSGAILRIDIAPLDDAEALYEAILEEGTRVKLDPHVDMDTNFLKDLFCVGVSSKKIKAAVWKCFERALYNNEKITRQTFEPENARQDYWMARYEVARVNLVPFTKSLYLKFKDVFEQVIRFSQA